MGRARSGTGQQAEAVTTEVDKQIDDLLSSIEGEETVTPIPKPRPKRSGKGKRGRRRVVVTGIGAITPLGLTVDEYWQGLIQGKSGIDFQHPLFLTATLLSAIFTYVRAPVLGTFSAISQDFSK